MQDWGLHGKEEWEKMLLLKFFYKTLHDSRINTIYSVQSKTKIKIKKCIQQNNPKIDKPKHTGRGLQKVGWLYSSPGRGNSSDTEQRCSKRPNENAQLVFFVETRAILRMHEMFFYFISLWAIARAATELFCNCKYKRRWFIWQSRCGSHDERVWGLLCWHAHTSYSLMRSSELQLTNTPFFFQVKTSS